jgi:two-component system sensor histidine kinase DesK
MPWSETGTVGGVEPEVMPASPADAAWLASQRRFSRGWRRFILPAVLLAYLFYAGNAVWYVSRGVHVLIGFAVIVAFGLCYLATYYQTEQASPGLFWALYGVLVALLLMELPFAHAESFLFCVYITQVTVIRLGSRSLPIVAALFAAAVVIPGLVPSWHDSLLTTVNNATAVAIPIVALATFGVRRVLEGNRALAEARSEVARLAAESERSRIARDLHDLLGHSLTTITVKTGLARRLGESDPARALQEIAEVERLARQSLADVRAAVSNYRDVTLAGELATGRELLRAAGIVADLPRAVDGVSPAHHELFGWVVREGLTNVVRHAHASTCAVRLSESSVEIVDDGVGGGEQALGTGLSGLRERVDAAGGVVAAGPVQPRGWRLRVSLAAAGSPP